MSTASREVRAGRTGRRLRLPILSVALLGVLPVAAHAQAPVPRAESDSVGQTAAVAAIPAVRFGAPDAATRPYRFTVAPAELGALQQPADDQLANRACPGCPARRPGLAIVEVLGINVLYNLVNQVMKPPEEKGYFRVGFNSWWDNLRYGFEWDDNAFAVNQIGHPYQGSNYFNAGRSNGLSFWESAPLAALGSATWEYFGETHKPSVNDLINTTVGGIAIGEMLHRTGWLIRDPTKTGKPRLWNEIFATVIDPITGMNRFISGDAGKVTEKPAEFVPSRTAGDLEAGVLWRGDNTKAINSTGEPYAQINLSYGDAIGSPYRQPYDAFTVGFRLGGGSAISEGLIRGRLYSRPLGKGGSSQFLVFQAYDYVTNTAYEFGGQSVFVSASSRFRPSGRNDVVVGGGGGPLLLGAFNSPYVFGQDRYYDYGPGLVYSMSAALRRDGFPIARVRYEGVYLHVVSGTSGDHVAQSLRLEGLVPLRRQLRLGLAADYIRRKVYYDLEEDRDDRYPQLRVFLAWVNK
ncbi:MAG: DUF3943 domain-containing protein [Vicinamibacterales bacterium]|nr:DUF3943 domain-containing protein [Vicinamibacterales bacterium]